MIPYWMHKEYQQLRCPLCQTTPYGYDTQQIKAKLANPEIFDPRPDLRIVCIVRCNKCQSYCRYIFVRECKDLYKLMNGLFVRPNFEVTLDPLYKTPPERIEPRGRMAKYIDRPISDREAEGFVKTLQRTSFKRDSKSFEQWLARFAIEKN